MVICLYLYNMFYLIKAPWIFKKWYHECIWNIPTDEKIIYLTFDDGPDPEATAFVLETLQQYEASATFFCIGSRVEANPEMYQRIIEEGHSIGNHTYDHLNGWKTDDKEYLNNVRKAAKFIDSRLFRPPYGRISKFQIKTLPGMHIIMWDMISADFDTRIKPEQCFLNITRNASKGSIVVFHDSKKALPNLKDSLPRVMEFYKTRGFQFKKITEDLVQKKWAQVET